MGMMDTSTRFEYRGIKKKVVLYHCYACPHYVVKHGIGNYCHNIKVSIREIAEPDNIPEWCPLQDDA